MPKDFFSTKIRIVKAMQKANKPLILQHIAQESKMTPQVVSYQVKEMLTWGIIGTVKSPDLKDQNTYYVLQPTYYDKNWMEGLYAILTPYIQDMAKQMDFTQANMSSPKALIRNLTLILRLFETEVEKLDLDQNGTVPA